MAAEDDEHVVGVGDAVHFSWDSPGSEALWHCHPIGSITSCSCSEYGLRRLYCIGGQWMGVESRANVPKRDMRAYWIAGSMMHARVRRWTTAISLHQSHAAAAGRSVTSRFASSFQGNSHFFYPYVPEHAHACWIYSYTTPSLYTTRPCSSIS
jgi:hypothetical protein